MFKNYMKIALQNMNKYKNYSLLNIAGLAIGIVIYILISPYVEYELSYDKHYKNSNRIYEAIVNDKVMTLIKVSTVDPVDSQRYK